LNVFDQLRTRCCPVCGSGAESASLFLEQTLDSARLNNFSFASRKLPEFMSYRLLRCASCCTVYAMAAPDPKALSVAYSEAAYDSLDEAILAADTYEAALRPVIASLPQRGRALDIGTGPGVFLEKLLAIGFTDVVGIEPSKAAIGAAGGRVRPFIREGIFAEEEFSPESFDLACCFQTLEHVAAPRELAQSCMRLLRPGGVLALVAHDYTATVNRLLGRRSPIIDIEHLQLFCRFSLEKLLERAGFSIETIRPLANCYPLRYWVRLSPFPGSVKNIFLRTLAVLGLDGQRIKLNVGNLLVIGRKPLVFGSPRAHQSQVSDAYCRTPREYVGV
jgi:SAM-dependent methyltransferase